MAHVSLPSVDEAAANANTLFAWLEEQPGSQSAELAEALFERLLARSSQSRSMSVNACTKLCGFVQHCARAERAAVRGWAFQAETAQRLLDFYLEWNEKDQHRSMKLVLDLLALLVTQNGDEEARERLRAHVLQTLVAIVSHKATRPLVKSAIGSLNHLLSKRVISLEEVAGAYAAEVGAAATENSSSELGLWQAFVADMFAWMTLHYVCPVAGKLLVLVFAHLRMAEARAPRFTVEVWLRWLRDGLAAHPGILEDVKLYFFIPLFKADRASSLQLLESLNRTQAVGGDSPDVGEAAVLQLSALEVGKKAGLVDDPGLHLGKPPRGIVLNEQVLDDVLASGSYEVRALALSLLISSKLTTKPYAPTAFALLKKHLPGCHAESDAKFRNELLSQTRDMGIRLKSAMAAMKRVSEPRATEETASAAKVQVDAAAVRQALAEHEAFLTWYLDFLRADLAPTASYQRHFTSLRSTLLLVRLRRDMTGSGDGATAGGLDVAMARRLFHDYGWVRCVLDLLMDPFDDIRETATALLALVPRAMVQERVFGPSGSLGDVLAEFSQRADRQASRTARADHADGVARCRGLLCSWSDGLASQTKLLEAILEGLESKLALAEADLGTAAVKSPVHGEFAAIRYVWEVLASSKHSEAELQSLAAVQQRIVGNARRVWATVRHVLCDDSPEGHLPQDLEDVAGLDTKGLLSYSFRSVSESSSTLRAMVGHQRFSRAAGTLVPTAAVFAAAGGLACEQLAALRHRGALTTVAQTFTLCCQLAAAAGQESLVATWYKTTLACMTTQVSTTRRSAGIPCLFSGILAASAPWPTFDEAIRTACDMARQPAQQTATTMEGERLPQVHALNCIRDVFRSSLLSKRAERLLPECLQLAAAMLRADVWAVRNCGLLLLRSLSDCLLGTGESKAALESGWDGRTILVSYSKYPALPAVLLGLLAADDVNALPAAAESVFPALDILRRAGPPDAHRDALYTAVVQHLGSRLWHVREMAARTVCAFLVGRDWAAGLTDLLAAAADSPANRLHGTLLAVRFMLARAAELSPATLADHLPSVLAGLDRLADANRRVQTCPEIAAAHLAARNTVAAIALGQGLDVLAEQASRETNQKDTPRPSPSALLRTQRVLRAHYAAAAKKDRVALSALVAQSLADPDTAARLLDAVPATWFATATQRTPPTAAWLGGMCADVCLAEPAPPADVQARALEHLADALDVVLREGTTTDRVDQIDPDKLGRVWLAVAGTPRALSPTLACAVLRVSGPVVAVLARADRSDARGERVAAWAAMLRSAGAAEQTLDMRLAAARAMRSFGQAATAEVSLLPFAFCVYDALNDDDDEVRGLAAEAAGTAALLATTRPQVPAETARQLPAWMAARWGESADRSVFFREAACRMLGTLAADGAARACQDWPAAADLLAAALQFDDALFLVEEQNLYVDEVREAQRWAAVLSGAAPPLQDLEAWLADGLQALVDRVNKGGEPDGPLGWTAAPAVFAVAARLLTGAAAVPSPRLASLRQQFRDVGQSARVHGLLLAMANGP